MSGYTYDVFLSYRRKGTAPEWVHNHFHPMLIKHLHNDIDHPQVFLDVEQIQTSDRWPDRLIEAHRRSRLLVAVWTPTYFMSRWCLAEWHTMRKRQQLLGSGAPGLIYPLVLTDGDRFPPEAQRTQFRDMKKWNNSVPVYRETIEYVGFENQVSEFAAELAERLASVPDWQPDWPVIDDPDPPAPEPPDVPRL